MWWFWREVRRIAGRITLQLDALLRQLVIEVILVAERYAIVEAGECSKGYKNGVTHRYRPAHQSLRQSQSNIRIAPILLRDNHRLHNLRLRIPFRNTPRHHRLNKCSCEVLHHVDPLANPTHDRHSHEVAHSFVARAIKAVFRWLVAIGDLGVIVGKTLQALTFAWC